jgi:hypothetical protein
VATDAPIVGEGLPVVLPLNESETVAEFVLSRLDELRYFSAVR